MMLALLLFAGSFTDQLWASTQTIYTQTLQHPFLRTLTTGTLPKDRFQYYLTQDVHYLAAFSKALRMVAAKAPREEWAATLLRHAGEAVEVEKKLHESLLSSYGIDRDAVEKTLVAPTNYAYANHMLAAASGTFSDGLAALLPCYWIYWEVGKELTKRGSRNPDYKRWIDQYSGEEYGATVREVLDMMNAEAESLPPEERLRAIDLFVLSARYEYMFWDMAWRLEQWPPAAPRPGSVKP